MPVVNAEGKLVGILDQADILRVYADFPHASSTGVGEESMQQAHRPRAVGEAQLSQVPLVTLGTPLLEVLHQVQETPLRRVIVIDSEGKAVGVIADLDILASRGLAARRNPSVSFFVPFPTLREGYATLFFCLL
jgi:CBS domain-containing protein